jgi:hypothetical protein
MVGGNPALSYDSYSLFQVLEQLTQLIPSFL